MALIAALIGVGTAYFALTGDDDDGGGDFAAFASDVEDSRDAGLDASAPPPSLGEPALPDPMLAREKHWERSRDFGPPPDGFGTRHVEMEKRLHRHFRDQLGDAIELCLDEGRERGETFEGQLVFHVSGLPRPRLKLGFRLNGIRVVTADAPDAGTGTELPADVYNCIWDTVEATEVSFPLRSFPLAAITKEPELFIRWDIRDESPADVPGGPDAGGPFR